MKVLHYVPRFSVISETFIYDQICNIEQFDVTSLVVTSKHINPLERPYDSLKTIPLRHILSERITQKLAFGYEFLTYFIRYHQWQVLLQEYQPDIVHCHTGNAAKTWLHIKKKLQLDIPTLISLHGSDVTMEPNIKPCYKKMLSQAATDESINWTVPSKFLQRKAEQTLSIPQTRISVVNNGFNTLFMKSRIKENNNQFILSIGRFIDCKGQKYLIRAFADLLHTMPDARLTLLGSGPKQEECQNIVATLGLAHKVIFIDSATHQEVAKLMQEHNVYVQPSIQDKRTQQEESFGVAALEALASGLPVVVTECGGLPEVVANIPEKYAKVIPQRDIQALSSALCTLLLSCERLPNYLIEEIASKFSMKQNAQKIVELYCCC